jgi:hypothetical protein
MRFTVFFRSVGGGFFSGLGRRRPRLFPVLFLFWFLFPGMGSSALAEGTAYWEWTKKADFSSGNLEGVSLSDNGVIRLFPAPVSLADLNQPFALSAVLAGADLVVGTGHSGQVFRVSAAGKSELLADFEEMDVTALAADKAGVIYAGTSPDGKIYRIGADRKPVVVADPAEKYIWGLAVTSSGNLLFSTGGKAGLYELDSAGGIRKIFTSPEANLTALFVAADGSIWFGTEPGGLVLRVDNAGKVSTVYDSPMREIRRFAQGADGSVFVLGNGDKSAVAATATASPAVGDGQASVTVSVSEDGFSEAPAAATSTAVSAPKGQDSGGFASAVYRIGKDLNVETLWLSGEVSVASIQATENGLIGGTAGKGRLIRIGDDGRFDILGQTGEEQVSFLLKGPDGKVRAVTSGFSKVYLVASPGEKSEGFFTSSVLDAKNPVENWGTVGWEGKGPVSVQTRTGNTQVPDVTWSDWSPEMLQPGGKITSPKARFFQIRLKLKGEGEVSSLRVAYLPKNVAPTISSLSVLPAGVALQEALIPPVDPALLATGLELTQFGVIASQPPRKVFQRGARSLQWVAEDKNGDQLSYRLSFRLRGETAWRKLAEKLKNSYFVIEAGDLPDGVYEFRLEVTDAESNAENFALSASRYSDPVVIDNTPPSVKFNPPTIGAGKTTFSFDVADTSATIKRVEYSMDGGKWSNIYPIDSVLDAKVESFTLTVEGLPKGDHFISVRVMDAGFNSGSEKLTFKIP